MDAKEIDWSKVTSAVARQHGLEVSMLGAPPVVVPYRGVPQRPQPTTQPKLPTFDVHVVVTRPNAGGLSAPIPPPTVDYDVTQYQLPGELLVLDAHQVTNVSAFLQALTAMLSDTVFASYGGASISWSQKPTGSTSWSGTQTSVILKGYALKPPG